MGMEVGKSAAGQDTPAIVVTPAPPVSTADGTVISREFQEKQLDTDYGAMLWGLDPKDSSALDYVRDHAEKTVERIRSEDPRQMYPSMRQVHDVRVYKVPEDEEGGAAATSSNRCAFRGVTRVAGTVETVLDVLAADTERESYWIALNTQRGLRATTMFGSRRLEPPQAYPRWSQKYMATRLTKGLARPVDACFAEYASIDDDPSDNQNKRGFVYRRSIHESTLAGVEEIREKISENNTGSIDRMYIQDWLYEVTDTQEPLICKVVLTCLVYYAGDASQRSMQHHSRDFFTQILISLRKVLNKQWEDQMSEAGVGSSTFSDRISRIQPGQTRCCGVCSVPFSLLRKRYTCKTCNLSICSRCCTKQRGRASSRLGSVGNVLNFSSSNSGTAGSRHQPRECVLCRQFGSEGGGSRISVNMRQHFTNSVTSTASGMSVESSAVSISSTVTSSITEVEDENDLFLDPDDNSDARSVVSSVADDEVRPFNESTDLQPPRPTIRQRRRYESVDSTSSARSVPGVVLLSDLDSLSLTGSFRCVSSASFHVASSSSSQRLKRADHRAVSEDNVLSMLSSNAATHEDECYSEDELANFNLKLL